MELCNEFDESNEEPPRVHRLIEAQQSVQEALEIFAGKRAEIERHIIAQEQHSLDEPDELVAELEDALV